MFKGNKKKFIGEVTIDGKRHMVTGEMQEIVEEKPQTTQEVIKTARHLGAEGSNLTYLRKETSILD